MITLLIPTSLSRSSLSFDGLKWKQLNHRHSIHYSFTIFLDNRLLPRRIDLNAFRIGNGARSNFEAGHVRQGSFFSIIPFFILSLIIILFLYFFRLSLFLSLILWFIGSHYWGILWMDVCVNVILSRLEYVRTPLRLVGGKIKKSNRHQCCFLKWFYCKNMSVQSTEKSREQKSAEKKVTQKTILNQNKQFSGSRVLRSWFNCMASFHPSTHPHTHTQNTLILSNKRYRI